MEGPNTRTSPSLRLHELLGIYCFLSWYYVIVDSDNDWEAVC